LFVDFNNEQGIAAFSFTVPEAVQFLLVGEVKMINCIVIMVPLKKKGNKILWNYIFQFYQQNLDV